MQRHLRLFLLLLLSFALPLNGMAGVAAVAEPCPMETQSFAMDRMQTMDDMQAMGDMQAMDDMQGSCCEDRQKQPGAGKTCKSGQQCKTGYTLQVSVIKSSVVPSSHSVPSFSHDFVPAPTPFGVWRPPRA